MPDGMIPAKIATAGMARTAGREAAEVTAPVDVMVAAVATEEAGEPARPDERPHHLSSGVGCRGFAVAVRGNNHRLAASMNESLGTPIASWVYPPWLVYVGSANGTSVIPSPARGSGRLKRWAFVPGLFAGRGGGRSSDLKRRVPAGFRSRAVAPLWHGL